MERFQAIITRLWNQGRVGKAAVIIPTLLIVFCCIGVINRPKTQQPVTGVGVQVGGETKPTSTVGPSTTPRPTNTTGPTNTPRPTDTPVLPTATPEPVVIDGSGDTVTDAITPPSGLNRVFFAHDGQRNFIVKVYTPDGKEDLMVNRIGRYAGVRPLVAKAGTYFEIQADGEWSIRIEPMGVDLSAADGIEGFGDFVSGVFEPTKTGSVPYTFKHTGESNFIVQLVCSGGADYVQNKIGAVDGSAVARFNKGPCFWDVRADGDWIIKPKE